VGAQQGNQKRRVCVFSSEEEERDDSSYAGLARRTYFWAVCALFIFYGAALRASAQAPATGAIVGRIFDPSGAVVPKANLSVIDEETNSSRSVVASPEGHYRVSLLPPGNYSLVIELTGFKRAMLRSVHVSVAEATVVDIKLELGDATSQVNVSGSSELVQTESASLGRVIEGNTINALPLANRNFSQILALSAGVIVELPNAANLGASTQNVSVNGAKATANNFQFNGIDANNISENSFAGEAFAPETGIAVANPDTIEEFKVQTGLYDASYGRSAGANVDLVAKAGTNNFHGRLWEFFRNDALNANDFFLNRNAQPRPVLKQNQFGGVLGGPLWKNKTFFLSSYQGTIQRDGAATGSLISSFLPALTNDRSAAELGRLFGGQSGANGGVAVAADGSNINPVALALLNFKLPSGDFVIPSPQTNVGGGVGQSTFSIPAKYREDQFSVNLDHKLSVRNQISGRFFYARQPTSEPFSAFAATVPGFGFAQVERNDMFVLSDTHVFTPNLVNVARFGFIRFDGGENNVDPINGADIGMQTPVGQSGIPGIQVIGLFTIGPPFQLSYFENTNTFVWQDTIAITRGRHSLRFGGEAKRHQLDVAPSPPAGDLIFLSFPDFLLGESATQNGSAQSNIVFVSGGAGIYRRDERYTDLAGFVQDDIKVTQRLTVNAGLRYELFGPPSETHGRLSNFDPAMATSQVPASGSFSGFVLPGNYNGEAPDGVVRTQSAAMWKSDYKNFGPRIGFALRLSNRPKIVLRSGYGIYYERLSGQPAAQNIGQPPFSTMQTLSGTQNAAATLEQPFNPPLPTTSAFPIFIPRTPDSSLFLASISRSLRSPYTQQYNLNVQYEFAPDFLWQIGYVGSKSTHLAECRQFNQAGIATPQNPVNGEVDTTNENVTQRFPFEGIAGGSYICETAFTASYNSLQTEVTKRFSHGLNFQGSYTFSKNLDFASGTGAINSLDLSFLGNDQTNPRASRGLSDFDRKHRLVLSFVYEPPRFAIGPGLLRYALSRWRFSGVSVLQSGLPITAMDSSAGSVYGTLVGFTRAQCTGINAASTGSLSNRLDHYFNLSAFAPPSLIGDGTGFGNCGVGILRGPDQRNLDLGIQREFAVAESSALQFRAEFFNFTNTPKFGLPVNDRAAGPAFGVISSTVSNPRIVQFALKYIF
jgi:Carboxypeptidase regulatory-like domain/TonB-dependent Receptor Plug Domain/TonB dependent receptor